LVLVGLGFWSRWPPGTQGNNVTWSCQPVKMLGARRLGSRRKSGGKTAHDNRSFVPRNSIPIKDLALCPELDPPTDSPDEAEIMARHVRHSRVEGSAQTERERGWPPILAKVWASGIVAAVSILISLASEWAAERSIFQTLRERWAIVAVSAILLFDIGLTIALALRQRRRAPRLTEKVTAAYHGALSGSVINPEIKAASRS